MKNSADQPRMAREKRTIAAMVRIYCRDQHGSQTALCPDCQQLLDYAHERLRRCPFQAKKTTCANCAIHCYSRAMRQKVREVMRYAGPRMIYRHPILALYHFLDGRRSTTA